MFKHNALTISLYGLQRDICLCLCFINGCFMATSVTHMGAGQYSSGWHAPKRLPINSLVLNADSKHSLVSDEILLRHWAKTKWNVVWREASCCPYTWKLLCVRKSNESLKYNHMLMCHANITLVKDVIEVGFGCAVADQIQLASWWWSWKRSTLTAS